MWMVFVPPFVPTLDLLSSFRFSPCPSFRSSVRFARFALLPVFRFALSFRLFVWACRRGGSCGGVWGGAVGLSSGVARCRGVCRVRCFCQLVFVGVVGGFWFSVLHVWRLVCSARLGGAGDAFPVLRVSVGAECGCDVASSRFSSRMGVPCRRVSPCRLVFSRRCHSRRCRRSFSCSSRRVCRVAACLASGCWSVSTWRCVVAGCGLCGVAWRCGVSWIVPWAVR